MKKFVVMAFAVVMLMSFGGSVFADSCGNWETYYTSNWCSTAEWCGYLNPDDAWMETQYQERLCVTTGNSTYWEYKQVSGRTGQCC
jgi:hypothetical protein